MISILKFGFSQNGAGLFLRAHQVRIQFGVQLKLEETQE